MINDLSKNGVKQKYGLNTKFFYWHQISFKDLFLRTLKLLKQKKSTEVDFILFWLF
jgi:hypothetical protein